mmetsp:Transcript_6414/g.14108  ORF Transcript_6414/g.14108 Transcript_6414/m.14108 type:complete len:96 (-) Transcript_6414:1293-1580(-)
MHVYFQIHTHCKSHWRHVLTSSRMRARAALQVARLYVPNHYPSISASLGSLHLKAHGDLTGSLILTQLAGDGTVIMRHGFESSGHWQIINHAIVS